jgi:hypothetical protein
MERGIVCSELRRARESNVSGCRCECNESQFDDKHAAKDLKRYRRKDHDTAQRQGLTLRYVHETFGRALATFVAAFPY